MTELPADIIDTIIEGDCLEVMRYWPDNCVDAVVTDIPYNEVNRESGRLRVLDRGAADAISVDVLATAKELARVVAGSIYVFCGIEQVSDLRAAFVALGLSTRHGIWWKTNPSPMNGDKLWLSAIENCIYAKKPRATFNAHCKPPVWYGPTEPIDGFPCAKPHWLMATLILASTNEGDIVLDPYLGSGTTAIAAHQGNRHFIGIELEPKYVEIARRRVREAQHTLFAGAKP